MVIKLVEIGKEGELEIKENKLEELGNKNVNTGELVEKSVNANVLECVR